MLITTPFCSCKFRIVRIAVTNLRVKIYSIRIFYTIFLLFFFYLFYYRLYKPLTYIVGINRQRLQLKRKINSFKQLIVKK